MFLLKFFLIYILFYLTNGYKTLIYNPKFAHSHVRFIGNLADTLASAGHDVVMYQPELNEKVTKTGAKNKNVRYYIKKEDSDFKKEFSFDEIHGNFFDEETFTTRINLVTKKYRMKFSFCEIILKDKENFDKMIEEKFDLGITEHFESCAYGIFKKIGLKKYITAYSSSAFPFSIELLGIQFHPSFLPGIMGTTTDKMTFSQRINNLIYYFIEKFMFKIMFNKGSELAMRKHFPEFSMDEAIADSAFYFVNSDEYVDYPQPITHKIIYMAGLDSVQSSKPLEKKYTDIFDSAKEGVIYFSFGSLVQSYNMKSETKKAFLEAYFLL